MKIINDLKDSNSCPSVNDLYSTVLPGKNPLLRSHLSKTGTFFLTHRFSKVDSHAVHVFQNKKGGR